MTKFKPSDRRCLYHPDLRAATCSWCYDLALVQQGQQLETERKEAHAQYLVKLEADKRFGQPHYGHNHAPS